MEENKIKTVVDVIKRDNYARLTKELKTKAEALAEIIRRKMSELDIDEIKINDIKYKINCVKSNNHLDEYYYLSVVKNIDIDYYCEYDEFYSLEDIECDYYYYYDFHCHIVGASNKDALRFINSANEFIQRLGEIEEEQVNEVNKVLSIADEIIASN